MFSITKKALQAVKENMSIEALYQVLICIRAQSIRQKQPKISWSQPNSPLNS